MLHTIAAFDRLGEENAFAVLARATALAQQGRDIVNLGIGQPDFKTPGHIVEAAIQALRDGRARICVATDVAARGIDIEALPFVVSIRIPAFPSTAR